MLVVLSASCLKPISPIIYFPSRVRYRILSYRALRVKGPSLRDLRANDGGTVVLLIVPVALDGSPPFGIDFQHEDVKFVCIELSREPEPVQFVRDAERAVDDPRVLKIRIILGAVEEVRVRLYLPEVVTPF